MRDLTVLAFVTLDGVMQSPSSPEEDASGGFTSGGWAAPYWEAVMPHVEHHAMAQPYDILFGRKTYDIFASYWPKAPRNSVSDRLNRARKYVVTSDPNGLDWDVSHQITGKVAERLREAKAQDGPLIQVHGSGNLIQSLIAERLIDEFRIWTFPAVVGEGKRLFEPGVPHRRLNLIKSEAAGDGAVMQVYRTV